MGRILLRLSVPSHHIRKGRRPDEANPAKAIFTPHAYPERERERKRERKRERSNPTHIQVHKLVQKVNHLYDEQVDI